MLDNSVHRDENRPRLGFNIRVVLAREYPQNYAVPNDLAEIFREGRAAVESGFRKFSNLDNFRMEI